MTTKTTEGIQNIDLRRAILAILLRERRPVSLGEIVHELKDFDRIDLTAGRSRTAHRRVADVLSWQIEMGRVERRGVGVYVVIPSRLSRTTRWRCLNWRELRNRRTAA